MEDCTDCKRSYFDCECEKCDDCNLNECMCNLNYTFQTVDSNEIRIKVWNLAKDLFNKKELDELKWRILNWIDDEIDPPKITNKNREFIYKLFKDAD